VDAKSQNSLSTNFAVTRFYCPGIGTDPPGEFPHEWNIPVWVPGIFFVSTLFVLPIGICIGWIKGFPRWSYPYVGHVIVFSLYMVNVATPGFLFGRELWGWRAWIPLMVMR
jgi:hypothetical protein